MELLCHRHAALFDLGWGVMLLRRADGAAAACLLDVEDEGIRLVLCGRLSAADHDRTLADFAALGPFPPLPPDEALRLLRDLAGWSIWVNGRPPPYALRTAEALFGTVQPADALPPHPPFGRSGGRAPAIELACYQALNRLEARLQPLEHP